VNVGDRVRIINYPERDSAVPVLNGRHGNVTALQNDVEYYYHHVALDGLPDEFLFTTNELEVLP
jgi:hypothetical protein